MSLYLSAALLQHHRDAILAAQGDYPTIHALLQVSLMQKANVNEHLTKSIYMNGH